MKFASVEELQGKIDQYFSDCDAKNEPYTFTGLALALDTSRRTLLDYEARDEYSHPIKKARWRVEAFAEKRLYSGGSPIGVIFNLKNNFGWKDKQEIDINDISSKSREELLAELDAIAQGKPGLDTGNIKGLRCNLIQPGISTLWTMS